MRVLFPEIIDAKLDPLEAYLETTEKFLEQHKDMIEGLPTPPPPNDDLYADEYWSAKEAFPNLLHSAVFVDSMAILEIALHRLCVRVQRASHIPLGPKDLTGRGIHRSRLYLTRAVQGFPFPTDNLIWQELTQLSELRNRVLHNDASLDGADPQFIAWVNGHSPKLSILEESIIIGAEFCHHSNNTIREFASRFPRIWP